MNSPAISTAQPGSANQPAIDYSDPDTQVTQLVHLLEVNTVARLSCSLFIQSQMIPLVRKYVATGDTACDSEPMVRLRRLHCVHTALLKLHQHLKDVREVVDYLNKTDPSCPPPSMEDLLEKVSPESLPLQREN